MLFLSLASRSTHTASQSSAKSDTLTPPCAASQEEEGPCLFKLTVLVTSILGRNLKTVARDCQENEASGGGWRRIVGVTGTCGGDCSVRKQQASKRRSPFPSFPSSHSSGARNKPSPPRRALHGPLSLQPHAETAANGRAGGPGQRRSTCHSKTQTLRGCKLWLRLAAQAAPPLWMPQA